MRENRADRGVSDRERPMVEQPELVVIGMGVGGEEVAGRAAEAGMRVLGFERKLVGGECPYWGCIPSKMMVRSANALAETGRVARLAGRATGEPSRPPVDGLNEVAFWTNRDAIEATELPRSLVVLGAGPIGLELAQAFHRFGTEVIMVEVSGHALPADEPENGEAIAEVLREEGIALHTGVSAKSVRPRPGDGGVVVELSDGTRAEGERLLVATGRHSDLSSLGVDAAGLDPGARAVEVDEHLRAGPGLWSVGDVTGKGAFTHMAVYQGRIAAADVLGRDHQPADYSAVPRVTFTDPEIAGVGLTEAMAREAGHRVRTASPPPPPRRAAGSTGRAPSTASRTPCASSARAAATASGIGTRRLHGRLSPLPSGTCQALSSSWSPISMALFRTLASGSTPRPSGPSAPWAT